MISIEKIRPETFGFKAAIFDFDGTLADSLDIWAKVDALFFSRRGLEYGPEYAEKLSALGFEDGARYTIETYDLSDSVQEVCDEWNRMGSELYATDVVFYPGAIEYVSRLKDLGIPFAIATTNHPDVLASMEPRIPITDMFPVRVHGCDVPHQTKEHPDIYQEAARRLGVSTSDCVLFEDLPIGIATAKTLGMQSVGYLSSSNEDRREALANVADLSIRSWVELLD